MQARIQRQDNVVTRNGGDRRFQVAQLLTGYIDLHHARPILAEEDLIEGSLHAGVPDLVSIGDKVARLEGILERSRDRSQKADHGSGQGAGRIFTDRFDLHRDSRPVHRFFTDHARQLFADIA